jgi:hypothetical protein
MGKQKRFCVIWISSAIQRLLWVGKDESTRGSTLVESGSQVLGGTKEVVNGARRDNDRVDARGVVTKNGDVAATEVWSRDVKEAISLWGVGGATGVNKASARAFVGRIVTLGV